MFSFFCLASKNIAAQEKPTRILFILDASSSMTYNWNPKLSRYKVAQNILLQIVDSIYAINNEIEFGIRAYGSQFPAEQNVCSDTKLIIPFSLQNVDQIKRRLQYLEPIGVSPIALSLSEAAFGEIALSEEYDYSLIFITDGGESCGGNICETYLKLVKSKVKITPYIIGLDHNDNLKSYYNCLGKFVDVTSTDDIDRAVKLIIDENRPIIDKTKKLNLKTIYSNTQPIKDNIKIDSIKKAEPIVIEIPKKDTLPTPKIEPNITRLTFVFPKLKYVGLQKIALPKQQNNIRKSKLSMPLAINFNGTEFIKTNKKSFSYLPIYQRKTILQIKKPSIVINKSNITMPIKLNIAEENQKIKKTFARLEPLPVRYRFVYAIKMPSIFSVRTTMPTAFNFIEDKPKVIKRDTIIANLQPKKVEANDNKQKLADVSRELIPHNETIVQIFLVDKFDKRKTYKNATPTIIVEEAASHKEIFQFIRKVNMGAPELIPMQAGTYSFAVRGRENIRTRDVKIEANQINKIYIELSDGTLQFAYGTNPKRPMTEFDAVVNSRFDAEKRPTVKQHCEDELYYPPGTYYVEIQTIPPTRFITVDIYFGAQTTLTIDEPGFLQITNVTKKGKVELQKLSVRDMVTFYDMEINGNFAEQKVMIQPGGYRLVYLKDPNVPALGVKYQEFKIQSNKTTLVELE